MTAVGTGDRRDRRRSGFTLLEMVLASLLAAILMVALVGVLRSVAQQREQVRELAASQPATRLLADQLRRDFVHARAVRRVGKSIRLTGYLARDPRTRLPTYRPATVSYHLQPGTTKQTSLLIRTEGTGSRNMGRRVEVMWRGVESMQVIGLDEGDPPSERGSKTEDEADIDDPQPQGRMPTHVRLVLRHRGGQFLLDEEYFPQTEFASVSP